MTAEAEFALKDCLVTGEELDHALHIVNGLNSLTRYMFHFGDAVYLYQAAISQNPRPAWVFVPCRDAGMSIYHFSILLKALRSSLRYVPTLKASINHQLLRTASRQFNRDFPDTETMRHAIAHQAELVEDLAALRSNIIVGDGSYITKNVWIEAGKSAMFQDYLEGATYYNAIDGKMVKFDITKQSQDKLIKARDDYFAAFDNIRKSSDAAQKGASG
jgi:hypothetical protein